MNAVWIVQFVKEIKNWLVKINLRELLLYSIQDYTDRQIEVMIYGDGAFKVPAGNIWELADSVVLHAYTEGLVGTGNELKIKYIADTELLDSTPDEVEKILIEKTKVINYLLKI